MGVVWPEAALAYTVEECSVMETQPLSRYSSFGLDTVESRS
jgi:hypothetical protein